MNLRLTWLDVANNPDHPLHLRLRARWIVAAQLLWIILAVIGAMVLLLSLPTIFQLYQQPCSAPDTNTCLTGQFSAQHLEQLRSSGISITLIAALLVGLIVLERLFELSVSAMLIWHRPDDRTAMLWSFVILTCGIGATQTVPGLQVGEPLGTILIGAWLFNGLALMPAFLMFPTGRFQPRWSLWLAMGMSLYYLIIFSLWAWIKSNPPLEAITNWVQLGVLLLVLGLLIYRYRRVFTLIERQQAKWAVYGFSLAIVIPLTYRIPGMLVPALGTNALFALFGTLLFFLTLFISFGSIGISILRYRLFDIDIIIKRTLVYAALTVLIIAVYMGIVSLLGALFRVQDDPITSLAATGVVAVIFQPLRHNLQRWVNRLLFGERDDPYRVLSRLGQQLKTIVTPQAMLSSITETVAIGLKLPYVAISLAHDTGFTVSATYGTPVKNPLILPLVHQNELVGQLIVASRTPGEAFSSADRRLLEDIAHQAGAVAQSVRLSTDLQRSRERLVTAREEERRRLRRDLHDGLGPTLASQTLRLDTIMDLLTGDPETDMPPDPAAAVESLKSLKGQTQAMVADIRRLVYELRPPALDELGLVAALQSHITQLSDDMRGLRIVVEAPDGLPPLSAAVEVAAYRIVLEALTNVIRHAQAHSCCIRLTPHQNGRLALQVEVIDDGNGLPAQLRAGVGLHSMRERAAELGGVCLIEPESAGGTHITARLPLPEAAS